MSIFSYVLRYDDGVAPNPFIIYCTLAVCKPVIRKNAKVGDWVIGTGSRDNVNRDNNSSKIIYAMKIDEIMSLTDYFEDSRFQNKKPNMMGSPVNWTGDNFYKKVNGSIFQLQSVHSNNNGTEDEASKAHDLKGENVLISKEYWYWGKNAKDLPEELYHLIKIGCAHKKITKEDDIKFFESWIIRQHKPTKFFPCQPLCEMDESGEYIWNQKTLGPRCFREDCKWTDEEETID